MTTIAATPGVTTETVDVAGRATLVVGAGQGAPVLYLHGLADLHSALEPPLLPPPLVALAGHRRVLAPAHPGYPGTEGRATDDVEDHVFHLLDLLDSFGLSQVDVIGHSFGGWLAAEVAVRHPERLRRLLLVSPLGIHVPGTEPALFFGAAAPRAIGGQREVRSVLFSDGERPEAVAILPDGMSSERQLRWFGGLVGAAKIGWTGPQLQDRKLAGRLRRASVPTSLLFGGADRLVLDAHARAWEDALPEVERSSVIAGAGHCLLAEAPADVTRTLLELFAASDGES
jgi:pimeloyl-ACP methyl ester carboxylesterase